MPPHLDPWDPQVPSLLEDAEPSRHANTLDPNVPEASHFLDNLDTSAFEPYDFDFSSLMDLDQIDDAALLDIPDLDMTDMSIGDPTTADLPVLETSDFQAMTTLDSESTLGFDQAWLRDAPGSAESGFPAIGAPASFPEPSNVTNVLSPPLALNNPGLPENCPSWGQDGNTSQFPIVSNLPNPIPIQHVAPAPSFFCETTIPTPVLGGQGQGSQSFVSQPVTGPVIRHRGPLPPARRGGRRGRLTREQAEQQLMARANGVCIRCRCVGITCEGGFPCKACLVLRKPRLWRSPCTKAQFLEIIESESFFLGTSMLRNVHIDSLGFEAAILTMQMFNRGKDPVSIDVLDKRHGLDWAFGLRGLNLLWVRGDTRMPSPGKIREVEKQLLREYPSGTAIDFIRDPETPDKFQWVYALTFFCSGRRFSNPHEEDAIRPVDSPLQTMQNPNRQLLWFYRRYGEFCLFNYLQEKANNPRKAAEDQKMFIYSALFVLKHSISERHINSIAMGLDGTNVQREVTQHLDRQTRVRTALWIFASVFVSKLPAYTDFWNHLPEQVDFFKCGPRKNVPKSLTDLDTDLLLSSNALFNQKRRLLKHLFSVEDRFGDTRQRFCEQDYSRFLWREMLLNTSQGVGEIEHISNGRPADLVDRARLYEQNEAERVMISKTREQHIETTRRFFGRLVAMAESPIIRDEASFHQTDGCIRPSSFNFIIGLSLYIHRIPGLCPYNDREYLEQPEDPWHNMNFLVYQIHESLRLLRGTVGCVKASERWFKLASLLGDAAYLMGRADGVKPHPFLDVVSLVESGTDDEFSRLHSLLSRNGSWIRATCVQLDGLVQALGQIFDADQLDRTRTFQRLLHRKCRIAFGEIVSLGGGSNLSRTQQLFLEDMKIKLLDFLPPQKRKKDRSWCANFSSLPSWRPLRTYLEGKEKHQLKEA